MSERIYLCERCNRPLRSAASKEIGYGPACARYLGIVPSKFRGKVENSSFSVGMVHVEGCGPICLAYFTGGENKDAVSKHPAFLGDRLAYYYDVRELWKGNREHVSTYLYDKDEKFYEVHLYQQQDLFGNYTWVADMLDVIFVQ